MDSFIESIKNYIYYFFPLILLVGITWYLAIFGEVDRSGEHKSVSHGISRKH